MTLADPQGRSRDGGGQPLAWAGGIALAAGLHGAILWYAAEWQAPPPPPSPPAAAIVMDLPPPLPDPVEQPAVQPAPELAAVAPAPELTPPPPETVATAPVEPVAAVQPAEIAPPPPPDVVATATAEPIAPEPAIEAPMVAAEVPVAVPVVAAKPVKPPPKPVVKREPAPAPPPKSVETPPTVTPPQAPPPSPPPAAAVTTPSPATVAAQRSWQSLLLGRLERAKRYPRQAQWERQEGSPQVRFTVDRSGKVLSVSLFKSSGYPLLDEEAVALVERADPLPPPPDEVTGNSITITVPVHFNIR